MATWSVEELDTQTISGQTHVVVKVVWKVSDTDDVNTSSVTKSTRFTYDPGAPFTQYNDLTETQVLGWVTSELGADGVSFYETLLTDSMATFRDKFPDVTNTNIFCDSEYVAETPTAIPWAS